MARDLSSLERFFTPRGVAVVGSSSEGKMGYELLRQMREGSYGGADERVFVVNPKAQGALGAPGYDAVAKIAAPVDLAIIASPPATVPAVLEDCGEAGVAAAAIITAGFSEVGDEEAEREVVEAAERSGVRFVGPNCAGIVNTAHRLYPTLETRPPAGSVAVVAQSGAIGGMMLAWAKQYRLGISKFVSYGNGADLNEIDLLWYLAQDPETEAVALYIETVGHGRRFMEALSACTVQKPVVVIKAGRTGAGQRATLSHSGSMAGADRVYEAALRQCGALRVRSVEEMFDACKAFVSLPRGLGRKVAIVTNSGGPGVLAADRGEEVGLDVRQPDPAVREALSAFLPGHCALENPVDLTVQGTGAWYRRALLALLETYDAAVAINVSTPYLDHMDLARGVCDAAVEAASDGDKAVVAAFLPEQIVAESVAYLEERGVPTFATGERAVAALSLVTRYEPPPGASHLAKPPLKCEAPESLSPGLEPPLKCEAPESLGPGLEPPLKCEAPESLGPGLEPPLKCEAPESLSPGLEPQSMAWLAQNDIPVPPFRFAESEAEAMAGCRELAYPVAMKIVSPKILHKSDVGGVILDVSGDEEARHAFRRLAEIGAGREFRGVILYPMIEEAQEVLLGLSRDPQFGPVVAFGLGGIYTEIWQDVALRVAPIERREAEAMVREIASFPLLEGARGQPRRDLDALADVLVRFSQLPFQYPGVQEVDLNPVFLFREGEGLLVGDVRVIMEDESA
jgi:acetyltransferase